MKKKLCGWRSWTGTRRWKFPAWIAQQYGVFSEEVGGEEEIREAVEDPYTHDW